MCAVCAHPIKKPIVLRPEKIYYSSNRTTLGCGFIPAFAVSNLVRRFFPIPLKCCSDLSFEPVFEHPLHVNSFRQMSVTKPFIERMAFLPSLATLLHYLLRGRVSNG
jgi:hypothetical protein